MPVPEHDGCVMFPGVAEQRKATTAPIYGGTAGVLLFLENAAAVLGSARARALADRAAAGLQAIARTDEHGITWAPPRGGDGNAALYIGDAGIGAAFLARARLRGDAQALGVATAIGTALVLRGERDGDELHWDRQVEIIYGAAGTALFLLDLAESVDAPTAVRLRGAALGVGRFLIAESERHDTTPPQRSWRWHLGGNQPYVGFSHGTAGVGYALLAIGEVCGDAACVQAGKDAAEWLFGLAIRDGDRLRWPVLPQSPTSMGGWCHGPPGTARTFLLLHAETGEARYLDAALASARWVMAQAGPADAAIPPQFPPSLCCGVAGAIDFFCDLYRTTGDATYAAFARRAADYLVDRAVVDGDGVKWPNGSNAHGGGAQAHSVDLMLGASGEAFALLRVLTLDRTVDPVVGLPDRRVTPRSRQPEAGAEPRAK